MDKIIGHLLFIRRLLENSCTINHYQTNFFLGLSISKAFADDKIKVTENLNYVLRGIENIVEKGEHAGYQHILRFTQCFLKASFSGSSKVRIVW